MTVQLGWSAHPRDYSRTDRGSLLSIIGLGPGERSLVQPSRSGQRGYNWDVRKHEFGLTPGGAQPWKHACT